MLCKALFFLGGLFGIKMLQCMVFKFFVGFCVMLNMPFLLLSDARFDEVKFYNPDRRSAIVKFNATPSVIKKINDWLYLYAQDNNIKMKAGGLITSKYGFSVVLQNTDMLYCPKNTSFFLHIDSVKHTTDAKKNTYFTFYTTMFKINAPSMEERLFNLFTYNFVYYDEVLQPNKHGKTFRTKKQKNLLKDKEARSIVTYIANQVDMSDENNINVNMFEVAQSLFANEQSVHALFHLSFLKNKNEKQQDEMAKRLVDCWAEQNYRLSLYDALYNEYNMDYNKLCQFLSDNSKSHNELLKQLEDPYEFLLKNDDNLFTWSDINAIVKKKQIAVDKDYHILAGAKMAYKELIYENQSSAVPFDDLIKRIKKKYIKHVPNDVIKTTLRGATCSLDKVHQYKSKYFVWSYEKDLTLTPENPDSIWLSSIKDFKHEYDLAEQIGAFFSHNVVSDFDEAKINEAIEQAIKRHPMLDPSQIEAIRTVLRNPLAIITGGPGTGKTFVISVLNEIFKSMMYVVKSASPTAQAAERIKMNTKEEADTIHRLFKISPNISADLLEDEDSRKSLNQLQIAGENFILDADVLVLDEASMLDNELTRQVFSRVNYLRTRIIIIGDVDQLPPIGRGKVFQDMIKSGAVPTARLNVPHRINQDSSAAENARCVRDLKPCDLSTTSNFEFRECENDEEIVMEIEDIVQTLKSKNVNIMDIQVLTPQKETQSGTNNLNTVIKNVFNPSFHGNQIDKLFEKSERAPFNVNDKVVHTRNNPDLQVSNGSVGIVRGACPLKKGNDTQMGVGVSFNPNSPESQLVVYDKNDLKELALAYSITTHKSQGSDYPFVIMVLSDSHYKMNTRRLVYTGMTRVKNKIFIVGNPKYLIDPTLLAPEQVRRGHLCRILMENKDRYNSAYNDIL